MRSWRLVVVGVGITTAALWLAELTAPLPTRGPAQIDARKPKEAEKQAIPNVLVADAAEDLDQAGDASDANVVPSMSESEERYAVGQETFRDGFMEAMASMGRDTPVDKLVAAGLAGTDAERIVREYAHDLSICLIGNQVSLHSPNPMDNPCLLNAAQQAGLTRRFP